MTEEQNPPAKDPVLLPIQGPVGLAPKDRSHVATQRRPWDNYRQSDTLYEEYVKRGEVKSNPAPPGWDRYEKDFMGAMLREGKINYAIVHLLYREGYLDRARREELVSALVKRIQESEDDNVLKGNLILALIHIGFDEEALKFIEQFQDEPWFASNWDVNFYAGTMLFRYRRYAEARPFLERAQALHPDAWARLWVTLAKDEDENGSTQESRNRSFQFGEHMGRYSREDWPFKDIADRLGIRRWHLAGALAFLDVDNDDYLDLVANGVYASPEVYLFRPYEGFVLRDEPVFDEISNVPPACVAADFDNDGYTDLYMTRAAWFSNGPNRLLRNVGGTHFEDMSERGDAALNEQNSCGATALDFDGDGWVDLAVSGTAGGTIRLLRNKGDFLFEDVTAAAGIQSRKGIAVGVCSGDVNNDGLPDIFVNSLSALEGRAPKSEEVNNALLINQGNGRFVDEAEERGVAFGTAEGFATWMFDYDNDGDLDIFASNLANVDYADVLAGFEKKMPWKDYYRGSALYKNDGNGHFTNIGEKAGIVPSSVMGAQFIDYDLDGRQDVVLGPGSHPLQNMQPLFVYHNEGEDQFRNVTPLGDASLFGKFHGIAFADYDRDGDPDLYVNNGGVLLSDRWRDLFLENQTKDRSWLHLRLVGTKSNRSAIGARVKVSVGGRTLMQEVAAGQGFSSTNSPYLIFGLADADHVDGVTIRWPSGMIQTLDALQKNQAIVVTEGESALRRVY